MTTEESVAGLLGRTLVAARKAKGMTQRQLADALGLSESDRTTISRWETGATLPTPPSLAALMLALDLDEDSTNRLWMREARVRGIGGRSFAHAGINDPKGDR